MLTVLSVLCPPLAVLLTAPTSRAAKTAGLTLLLYVPGMLYARAVVEEYRVRRRYAHMLRLLDARATAAPELRAA
ncbi:MAG: YqaE/Pmp3 family membrane protein [Planctomycetes bacterium]|nr:YqaE/Pmp3 family membrane protein [Planctomycetota bacterium]